MTICSDNAEFTLTSTLASSPGPNTNVLSLLRAGVASTLSVEIV
eukprot:CAMPEP_0177729014 /NCGR_PEP_ID=MMETSP0484_2-20121128/21195_1 /TAXON_ID=354590 /ORGANISM="Rhodomonas lens, Strain RHODO" /LENGTH=43 /DNA_ID= /DNA_START= /DNA_END= /DNA_ORIENTATION=